MGDPLEHLPKVRAWSEHYDSAQMIDELSARAEAAEAVARRAHELFEWAYIGWKGGGEETVEYLDKKVAELARIAQGGDDE